MRLFYLVLSVSLSLVLCACGGSGGSASPPVLTPVEPPPPVVTPPPQNPAIPAGGSLLFSAADALNPTAYLGNSNDPIARLSVAEVSHPDFSQALQVDVLKPSGEFWDGQILISINSAVAENDVLLAHVFLRSISSDYETGSSFTTLFMEGPAPDYHKFINREISANDEWQEYFIPIKITQAFSAGNLALKFGVGAGNKQQSFQLGGLALYNYQQSQSLDSLPVTALSYDGRASDAPWRAAALARIEQHRKGDFNVQLKDSQGQPLSNAQVELKFVRHAYHFGSVIAANRLLEQSADGDKYREVLLDYFNQSGTENDLKWAPWAGEWGNGFNQQQTLDALSWLKQRNFYTRGHVLVWPSKRNLPELMQGYLPDDPANADPAAKQRVLEHIDDITQATSEWLDEWDVLNEPYDNHYLMDAFGDEVMLDWFNQARINLPEHGLFINDYAILSGGGRNTAHQQHYQDTIEYLVNHNAPITGIGLQSHFSENLTAIDTLYALLERYHNAFPQLTIRATEFDISTQDEQLQADYTGDFLTLFFSHPATVGVQLWGFWAGQHWVPEGAMFAADWRAKPAAEVWHELIYQTWWNDFSGQTDAQGSYSQRGFYGDYQLNVSHNGQSYQFDLSLRAGQNGQFEFTLN